MNYRKKYEELLNLILSNEDGLKMTVGTSLEFQKEYEFEIKKWKKHTEKLINIEKEIKKYIKKRNSLLLEVI